MGGVYKIINSINGKYYIGSTKNFEKRKVRHFKDLAKNKHHNAYLQKSFNKHGESNFKFEILIECENYFEKEQEILNNLDFTKCYNIGKNACGGDNYTNNPKKEELRIFLTSELNKHRNKNRNLTGKNNPNYKHGKSTIGSCNCKSCGIIISIGAEQCKSCYFKNRNISGNKNPFYGKIHSKETIEKIRKANIGKASKCRKAVIVGDLEFESITKAALFFNVTQNTIINRIRHPNFPEYKIGRAHV